MRSTISVTMRLSSINNPTELLLLFFSQINISRCPVLLQPLHLGRSRDSNHTLGGHPSESDLTDTATLANGEFLDLFDNGLVLVEIVALEFGCCDGEGEILVTRHDQWLDRID